MVMGCRWTTERHYAVPTTDLPLHRMPRALAWFNALFADSIGPALARLFQFSAARLRVHDAFLVRYRHPEGDRAAEELLRPYRLYLQDRHRDRDREDEDDDEGEEEQACRPSQRYLPLQYVSPSLFRSLSVSPLPCPAAQHGRERAVADPAPERRLRGRRHLLRGPAP